MIFRSREAYIQDPLHLTQIPWTSSDSIMSTKPIELTPEDWQKRYWQDLNKEPYFHRKQHSEKLLKYHDILFPNGTLARVLVPCCGKSLDMIYMADRGHEVVGIEFAKGAIERFHQENALTYTKEKHPDGRFVVYTCKEKNIKVFQGDLFDMKPTMCGMFDAVWDRGGYNSINVSSRKLFCELVTSLLKDRSRILLETFSYKTHGFRGPPHCITEKTVSKDFESFATFTLESIELSTPWTDVTEYRMTVSILQLK